MQRSTEQIHAGLAYLFDFFKEAMRAIRGRIVYGRIARVVTKEQAREYFELRSSHLSSSVTTDIIAVRSRPYRRLLSTKMISDEIRSASVDGIILDYGCGRAAALRDILRDMGFKGSYVGCDIDRVAVLQLSVDARDELSHFCVPDGLNSEFDLAVACNVVVYNQDDDVLEIFANLRKGRDRPRKMIVFEPYPRWYWEFMFDGIRLCPRDPASVMSLMEQAGWTVTGTTSVCLLLCGSLPLFQIAYGIVAKATPKT